MKTISGFEAVLEDQEVSYNVARNAKWENAFGNEPESSQTLNTHLP